MPSSGMRSGCALAIVVAAWACVATAAPPPVVAGPSAAAAGVRDRVPGLGTRVSQATLAKLSGGTDAAQRITINGSVSNTSTTNVTTGYNWIGGGAFGNAAGLPMVIQNSGNSVLIQNATIVNVQLQP